MADYLGELNRIVEYFADRPDVVAIAAIGGGTSAEFLMLSELYESYVTSDDWWRGLKITLETSSRRGRLVEQRCIVADVGVTLLFGDPSWLFSDSPSAEILQILGSRIYELHDPSGLIKSLQEKSGVEYIGFADESEIAQYGDISSDFFRLVGLGTAGFISNDSTLTDWCDASGLPLDHANARIRELYDVDVADLNGGRLTDIFQRIAQGEPYQAWRIKRATDENGPPFVN